MSRKYWDKDGNEISLIDLVKKEPEWAVNFIQHQRDTVSEMLKEERGVCGLALHKVAEEKGWRSISLAEAMSIVINAGEKGDD